MEPLDEALQAGFSIAGVSTWFSYSQPASGAGKMSGTRHLQVIYLQKGAEARTLYEEVNSHGRTRWVQGDL